MSSAITAEGPHTCPPAGKGLIVEKWIAGFAPPGFNYARKPAVSLDSAATMASLCDLCKSLEGGAGGPKLSSMMSSSGGLAPSEDDDSYCCFNSEIVVVPRHQTSPSTQTSTTTTTATTTTTTTTESELLLSPSTHPVLWKSTVLLSEVDEEESTELSWIGEEVHASSLATTEYGRRQQQSPPSRNLSPYFGTDIFSATAAAAEASYGSSGSSINADPQAAAEPADPSSSSLSGLLRTHAAAAAAAAVVIPNVRGTAGSIITRNQSKLHFQEEQQQPVLPPNFGSTLSYNKKPLKGYWKSELCRFWSSENPSTCHNGSQCRWAHGIHDIARDPLVLVDQSSAAAAAVAAFAICDNNNEITTTSTSALRRHHFVP